MAKVTLKDILSKSWARAVRTNTNNTDHFMLLLVVFDVKRVKDVVIILQTSTHNNNVQFRRVRLKWTPGFTFATVDEKSGDIK